MFKIKRFTYERPDVSVQKEAAKSHPSEWWHAEDGLFNLDEGWAERQQCVIAASNILQNFSFIPENEVIRGHHRHCLKIICECMEDHVIGEMTKCYMFLTKY
ncbi:armadillo repeat-containing protein LFR [Tanacetum coccineum]